MRGHSQNVLHNHWPCELCCSRVGTTLVESDPTDPRTHTHTHIHTHTCAMVLPLQGMTGFLCVVYKCPSAVSTREKSASSGIEDSTLAPYEPSCYLSFCFFQ